MALFEFFHTQRPRRTRRSRRGRDRNRLLRRFGPSKRESFVLAVSLAFAGICLGCAAIPVEAVLPGQPALRAVVHAEMGLVLDLPADWTVRRNAGSEAFVLQGWSPREYSGDFRENFTLVHLPFPRSFSVNEVRAANLREIVARYPGARLMESGSFAWGDEKAGWAVIEVTVEGFVLKDKIYYFVQDRQGLVLTCSAALRDFGRFEEVFDRIARSLRWNEDGEKGGVRELPGAAPFFMARYVSHGQPVPGGPVK